MASSNGRRNGLPNEVFERREPEGAEHGRHILVARTDVAPGEEIGGGQEGSRFRGQVGPQIEGDYLAAL